MPPIDASRSYRDIIFTLTGENVRSHESLGGYTFDFFYDGGGKAQGTIDFAEIDELCVRFFTASGHLVEWKRADPSLPFERPVLRHTSFWLWWRRRPGRYVSTQRGIKNR